MGSFNPFVPKGQINIYRFVPLDETYQNTLHFRNRESQLAYFGCDNNTEPSAPTAHTIKKLHFSGQTFTRNERQYIHIEGNACNYYDCNYMSFQNQDFGQMWFFAFIHSVEYVNNNVTEIVFEIDVMQSFMWNYELRECFVVREHSWSDHIGDSLTAEKVPEVAYKNSILKKTNWFDDYSVCLVASFDVNNLTNADKPIFKKVGNLPFGGSIKTFPDDDYATITQYLENVADNNALDGLVTMLLFPSHFTRVTEDIAASSYDFDIPTDVNGYTPANNKLFTFPFTYLEVDCGNNSNVYKFEYFDKDSNPAGKCRFIANPVMGALPQIRLHPYAYDNADGSVASDFTKSLVMENFPIVQYSGDNAANWYGRYGWASDLKIGISVAAIVAGTVFMSPAGGAAVAEGLGAIGGGEVAAAAVSKVGAGLVAAGAGTAFNENITKMTNMNVPATARSTSSAMSEFATKQRNFYFKCMQPTKEGARIIDDIFTMYGYAINKVKTPNIRFYDSCRPHFNYVKCANMSFHWELFATAPDGKGTSVPQKYMNKIMSIYQNGITFWKNPNEVGRYAALKYNNAPPAGNNPDNEPIAGN